MANLPDRQKGGPIICTIVAKNYISHARTLAQSFLQHHPGGQCFVLVVDKVDGLVKSDAEPFDLVKLEDLGIAKVETMAMKYNITEFSTSVKPFFLEYLLELHQPESLMYLDPDILVTGSLEKLSEELSLADIILTPHLDTDYPDDGLLPDDSHIMRSGIFNLGFLGIRNCENSRNFLHWWQIKLSDRCVVDPWKGYMVDQKFIDYAYVLFRNISIIHDTSFNVAYWNIHSRFLEKADNGWLCNGKPLKFFHFSNYRPEQPDEISKYQTRFSFQTRPDLKPIFDFYGRLLRENGYDETSRWTYTWSRYSNGKNVSHSARRYFRNTPKLLELEHPFDYRQYSLLDKLGIFGIRARGYAWGMVESFMSRG